MPLSWLKKHKPSTYNPSFLSTCEEIPHDRFFLREALFKPPSRRSPPLILFHSPSIFYNNINSITGDGGEAFCLF